MKGILKTSDPTANRWLFSAAAFGGLLLVLTFVGQTWESFENPLEPFNLGRESAIASWYASAWLLWSSLLLVSLSLALWRDHKLMGLCMMVLAWEGMTLCIDESGSLHERIGILLPASLNLSLKKVGLIGAVPLCLCLLVWWRKQRQYGKGWILIALANLVFASVAIQELIEQKLTLPDWIGPTRTTIEEGTELIGFYLLSLGAIKTTHFLVEQKQVEQAELSMHGVIPTPQAIKLVFCVLVFLAPFFILWRLNYDPAEMMSLSYHGDFASAMMMVIYLTAGWACRWRAQNGGPPRAWNILAIAMVCLSMLNIWHPYAHFAGVQMKGDLTADRLRAFYDMLWALLIYLVISLWLGPKEKRSLLGIMIVVLVYAAVVVAAVRGSLVQSYIASYLSAVGVGGWTLYLAMSKKVMGPEPLAAQADAD